MSRGSGRDRSNAIQRHIQREVQEGKRQPDDPAKLRAPIPEPPAHLSLAAHARDVKADETIREIAYRIRELEFEAAKAKERSRKLTERLLKGADK